MKTYLDCMPCFIKQSLEAARMATDDTDIQIEVVRNVMKYLHNISLTHSPPELSREVHRIIRESTPAKDPYKIVKDQSNEMAKKKYPYLKGRKIIFHPARIGLAKGCDISIKAVNIVKDMAPDVMLVLAGSKNIIDWGGKQQKDIAYLVGLVKHFNMEKNVLIDMYTLEEVKELYEISDICLYPSTAPEPFGLTMLEAMAMAKPIIATSVCDLPEILKGCGWIVEPEQPVQLAEAIRYVFDNPEEAKEHGLKARIKCEKEYSWDAMEKILLPVFRKYE